jgi:preprotein translocase subunit SecG
MGFLIGLLTVVMVLDCMAMIFLVLIQLPKKDAGAGLAFGGSASDALFGSGSGTVLTKITKYAATIFFVLALILAALQSHYHSRAGSEFQRMLEQPGKLPPAGTTSMPATMPAVQATATNLLTTPVPMPAGQSAASPNPAPISTK